MEQHVLEAEGCRKDFRVKKILGIFPPCYLPYVMCGDRKYSLGRRKEFHGLFPDRFTKELENKKRRERISGGFIQERIGKGFWPACGIMGESCGIVHGRVGI